MAETCFKNGFRSKSQDSTNMRTRRQTPTRDVVKNDRQVERPSRIQDMEGGRGSGKRPS